MRPRMAGQAGRAGERHRRHSKHEPDEVHRNDQDAHRSGQGLRKLRFARAVEGGHQEEEGERQKAE